MPDPTVVQALRAFKFNLEVQDAVTQARMAQQWMTVEKALDERITALAENLDAKRRDGEHVTEASLFRLGRYKELLTQAQDEFGVYAKWADSEISERQRVLGHRGIEDSQTAIQLSYPEGIRVNFTRLPSEAVENMVGLTGEGRPVRDLLLKRMVLSAQGVPLPGVIDSLTENLVVATALGWNPRKTALQMKNDLTGGLQKALVIARSEQMRVYRFASQQQYQESGVVLAHKRLAAHGPRTCAACLAMEGERLAVNEVMYDHPNGRCTSVPVVSDMPEITWLAGEEWVMAQPDEVQQRILGPGHWAFWKAGGFAFKDLTRVTEHSTWGKGLQVRSLTDLGLLGPASALPLFPSPPPPAPVAPPPIVPERPAATTPLGTKGQPESLEGLSEEQRGVTQSYIAEWADGSKALFKPERAIQGEHSVANENAEVAAYRLAQLLGYDAVPVTDYATVVEEGTPVFGSLQRWVSESHIGLEMSERTQHQSQTIIQRTRMALFDQVIANHDRHGGNFLEDLNGKLWAIDHGLAFHPGSMYRTAQLERAQREGVFGEDIYSRQAVPWARIPGSQLLAIQQTLRDWGQVPPEAIDDVMTECNLGDLAERLYLRIQQLTAEMEAITRKLESEED